MIPYATPVLNASGEPDLGATLTIYNTGTTTPAAIFSDPGLTTPIANPQTADSAGRFTAQASVWWADSSIAYDALLHFSAGSVLTFDELYVLGAATNVSGFAPINSPTFTGNPQAPTPASNDVSASIATTQFVSSQGFAPLDGPTFTGVPSAPTAAPGTNTTQLATTAFALAAAKGSFVAGNPLSSDFTNGLIVQGGFKTHTFTNPGDSDTLTYPLAFPTACVAVVATLQAGSGVNSTTALQVSGSPGLTTATLVCRGFNSGSVVSCPGYFWIAIGY